MGPANMFFVFLTKKALSKISTEKLYPVNKGGKHKVAMHKK